MKVYITGKLEQDPVHGESLSVSLLSSVVLFVLNYCKTSLFHVILVEETDWTDETKVRLKSQCLQNVKAMSLRPQDIPAKVSNCVLPVIEDENDLIVRCGLCCVIRYIIKISHAAKEEEHLIDLLGFRGASLKACAEISGWTKLCEVELPCSVSGLIQKFRQERDLTTVEVPEDLMKLELHFDKPPLLHNDDKAKRIILKDIQTEFENKKEGISKDSNAVQRLFASREEDMPHGKVRYRVVSPGEREARKFTNTENGKKCKFGCTEHRLVKWCAKCNDRNKLKQKEEIQERNYARLANSCDTNNEKSKSSRIEIGVKSVDNKHNELNSVDILCDYVVSLTLQDIVYDHLFTEGAYFTIADIMLFVYLYHLAEPLLTSCSNLLNKLPNIRRWLSDVMMLKPLQNTASGYGFQLDILQKALATETDDALGPSFTVPIAPLIVEEEGNEIGRGTKARQKALKKDLATLLVKIRDQNIVPSVGQHPCGENVHINWESVPQAAHPKIELPEKRVGRKCEQLENLAMAVQSIAKPGDVIVDFCSGAGHLGIIIAYLLPECKVNLVDNNEESVQRACTRVTTLGLTNVTLFQCNLDYFQGHFDIGVCLHACGVATDLVLQQCLDRKASFVICPCCYGNIQNTHLLSYPRSQFYKEAGLTDKDVVILGHAADQTEENIDLQQQGRYCMNLVDTDRAKLAEESGYLVTLCSLQPLSCTPKNNLLIGTTLTS